MHVVRDLAAIGAMLAAASSAGIAQQTGSGGAEPPAKGARPAHAAVADTASATVRGPDVKVNQFMSYDPGAKVVNLKLVAAFGHANGGMNFNGGARGDETITVPEGWQVKASFVNHDAIPHSAIILPDSLPFPAAPENPAIPGAYTKDVTAGLPTDGTDTMNFKASKPGNYLIVCGVPGHAPSGMYIKFVISPTAKAPTYTTKGT
jgi:sulfocyanin